MTFRNSILAGSTLIREAIESQNFQSGVEGWQIAADGTAEFSDLTIRSSDGLGRTIVVANGRITIRNAANIVVTEIDSDGYRLYNGDGVMVADLRLDPSGQIGGLYTRGFQFGDAVYSYLAGGTLVLGPVDNSLADVHAFVNYVASTDLPEPYSVLTLSTGLQDIALDTEARVQLVSQRGYPSRVWIDGGSGMAPADLIVTGTTDTASLKVLSTEFTTYVPAITGHGSATFTTRTGWFYRFGSLVIHGFTLVVGTAGTGTSVVQIGAPTSIYRAGRQAITLNGEGLGGTGNSGVLQLVSFTSGSGSMWDRLRNSAGANVVGSSLAAGAFITGVNIYREF
ncbi:hypothetical protein GTY62_15235 [Streptomyces sp. SID724]|uniref:hypothetical protein n=1 Tax=Streptomyces sp. SID724 TaxID=2690324 RepID=UPI001361C297|nr:hypothetical protein [Streptomyces sp. SID724]